MKDGDEVPTERSSWEVPAPASDLKIIAQSELARVQEAQMEKPALKHIIRQFYANFFHKLS